MLANIADNMGGTLLVLRDERGTDLGFCQAAGFLLRRDVLALVGLVGTS